MSRSFTKTERDKDQGVARTDRGQYDQIPLRRVIGLKRMKDIFSETGENL